MKLSIFLGPTVAQADASKILAAAFLPPVAQGDVFRAAREGPFAIGIIDGYFDRVPAVWHKEILWAMSQGIHVFGAASMGALRAAELAKFGMKGVGDIYEAFHSGELEDDDEVAIAHGDESTGYRASSEAMVNIRATLRAAERSGVIPSDVRAPLEILAKRLFYPDRSYGRLLHDASETGFPASQLDALRAFIASNRVDQKRVDALAMLEALKQCCLEGRAPSPPTFSFAHTEAWDQVVDWAESQPPLSDDSGALPADLLATEVRQLGSSGRALLAGGLNRVMASALARRVGTVAPEDRIEKLDRSRRRAGGLESHEREDGAELEQWIVDQALTKRTYQSLLERQVELDCVRERFRGDLDRHVVDELRATGDYPRILRRARAKQLLLAKHGLEEPTLEEGRLSAEQLLEWYCLERLGCPPPGDLESLLLQLGIADAPAMQREALRELLYIRLSETSAPT